MTHFSIVFVFLSFFWIVQPYIPTDIDMKQHNWLCNGERERYIDERGSASSLTLDLHPGTTINSCKREFAAPESHTFFVRLQKIKTNLNKLNYKRFEDSSKGKINSTGSCPLSIVSIYIYSKILINNPNPHMIRILKSRNI